MEEFAVSSQNDEVRMLYGLYRFERCLLQCQSLWSTGNSCYSCGRGNYLNTHAYLMDWLALLDYSQSS